MNLKNRHFLKLLDFTPEEITAYLDLAAELKAAKKAGREVQRMKGKNIALIFEKHRPAPAARLKSPRATKGRESLTWSRPPAKSGIRKASKTPPAF